MKLDRTHALIIKHIIGGIEMSESMESRMGRVMRRLYLQAFEDGTPKERKEASITRSRFNRARLQGAQVQEL